MEYSNLKIADAEIYEQIQNESNRQKDGIELIASENYVSAAVLDAMGSILTNKYSEGMPNKRYYGGNDHIDSIENIAISRAKELFGAEHVNVQPYSGSPANLAVYLALINPGDAALGMELFAGGHLTHGYKVSVTGRWFSASNYGVNDNGYIDYDSVLKLAKETKPKLIWAGFSAYSRTIEWQKFRDIADEVDAYLAVDIAHIAGLIAGKQLLSPVGIADVVTTTTHKTLRGPRGAMIFCKEEFATKIDKAVFPGLQGGPHNHTTAGIAVALKEALDPSFVGYARQVIINAQALAKGLTEQGFKIVSGGTDNHLMLMDLSPQDLGGKEIEHALELAGITVNKNTIPGEKRSPFDPSGIRIGTAAMTTRGLKEVDMATIAKFISDAIQSRTDEDKLRAIAAEVKAFVSPFPIPGIST
jgi:glycine hydroxymethyltransferase